MKYSRYISNNFQVNIWFYLFVALMAFDIEYFFHEVFKGVVDEDTRIAHEVVAEYSPRCPKGYYAWETHDYMHPIFTDRDGDSVMIFEQQVRTGCRLFLTGSETPEMIQKQISTEPVVDSVYYKSIVGSVNLRAQVLLSVDTNYWVKVREKCPYELTKDEK